MGMILLLSMYINIRIHINITDEQLSPALQLEDQQTHNQFQHEEDCQLCPNILVFYPLTFSKSDSVNTKRLYMGEGTDGVMRHVNSNFRIPKWSMFLLINNGSIWSIIFLFFEFCFLTLHHNHDKIIVGSHHDLVLCCFQSNKFKIVLGIQIPHYTFSLVHELRDQSSQRTTLLLLLVHECGSDETTLRVHNHDPLDILVCLHPIECFLNFRHFKSIIKLIIFLLCSLNLRISRRGGYPRGASTIPPAGMQLLIPLPPGIIKGVLWSG